MCDLLTELLFCNVCTRLKLRMRKPKRNEQRTIIKFTQKLRCPLVERFRLVYRVPQVTECSAVW